MLRITPNDGVLNGTPDELELSVDNNKEPSVILSAAAFVVNPDERGGIPIPFTVLDGTAFPGFSLSGSGGAALTFLLPATPPGFLASLQGVVIQPAAPCSVILTAAFEVSAL